MELLENYIKNLTKKYLSMKKELEELLIVQKQVPSDTLKQNNVMFVTYEDEDQYPDEPIVKIISDRNCLYIGYNTAHKITKTNYQINNRLFLLKIAEIIEDYDVGWGGGTTYYLNPLLTNERIKPYYDFFKKWVYTNRKYLVNADNKEQTKNNLDILTKLHLNTFEVSIINMENID